MKMILLLPVLMLLYVLCVIEYETFQIIKGKRFYNVPFTKIMVNSNKKEFYIPIYKDLCLVISSKGVTTNWKMVKTLRGYIIVSKLKTKGKK